MYHVVELRRSARSRLADYTAPWQAVAHSPDNVDAITNAMIRGRRWLFNLGGAAALLLLALLLVGAAGMISAATNTSLVGAGLGPLANNWLVTLFKVNLPAAGETSDTLAIFNLLDLFIMVLFVIFSVSFYPALRPVSRVWSLVAVSLPLLGIPLFVATGMAGRSALLVSGLIMAILQVRSRVFGTTIAAIGIIASAMLFFGGDIATAVFQSSSAVAILLAIGYVLWQVWFLLSAPRLFHLGRAGRLEAGMRDRVGATHGGRSARESGNGQAG